MVYGLRETISALMIAIHNSTASSSPERAQDLPCEWFPAVGRVPQWLTGALFLGLLLVSAKPVSAQDANREGEEWYPEILETSREMVLAQQTQSESLFLPNYSFAGYRWGEQPLSLPAGRVLDVTDFGAIPDDGEDDTDALQHTFTEAHQINGPVIVRFSEGRFILREILFIERSNIVVQGQGSGENGTTLYVPRPLREVKVPAGFGQPLQDGTSQFSWRGGVIWTRMRNAPDEQVIARATAGRRGYHAIRVDRMPAGVDVGDVVRIQWYNREGNKSSLLRHIYCASDLRLGKMLYERPERAIATQEVTIAGQQGRTLFTKEPLLHDLRSKWRAEISTVHFLEGVGLEGFRIAFPDTEYAGHHDEEGYNGLYLTDLMHSWVRDVAFMNADSGILSGGGKNITVSGVQVLGRRGHYSLHVGSVYGVLMKDFSIEANSVHNPSFNTYSRLSVYTGGSIVQPKLDQHRGINHQNLFDNLDAVYGEPWTDGLFRHGGSLSRWGPVAGAFNTFWNIRVQFVRDDDKRSVRVGDIDEAPHSRIVGLHNAGDVELEVDYGPSPYIEGLNRPNIAVPSLYEYQLQQRRAGERPLSIAVYDPLPGDRFNKSGSITVRVAAIDDRNRIERVVFLADGSEIGADTDGADGWSTTWSDPAGGSHTLRAVAYDEKGRTVASSPLSCTGNDVSVWLGEEDGNLGGNYPNPFKSTSTIEYALADDAYVQLELYDIQGRRVAVVEDGMRSAGKHTVRLNGSRLSSGVYFYRLRTDTFSVVKKAVVVR